MNPDQLQHEKWCLIADKIQQDPALLKIPLNNAQRWAQSRRDGVAILGRWRKLIEAAQADVSHLADLLTLLRSDDEKSRFLKSYSPFPGVLTSEEVDRFTCSWRH